MAKVSKKQAKRGGKMANVSTKPPQDPIAGAFAALHSVGDLLRRRLAEIDPLDHPTRWAGVNDEIRGLEERLAELRGEHQRVTLARAELRSLGLAELAALEQATTQLTALVRAAERVAVLTEAAGVVLTAASTAIEKLRA